MKRVGQRMLALVLASIFLVSLMPMALPEVTNNTSSNGDLSKDVSDSLLMMDADFNLTNDYQKIWEPNNIRGSSHAVAATEDGEYMASAGGYLNDREVHIYRWWDDYNMYYPIYDAGDTEIGGDVLDVAFMDADNDNRLEVVAASADGKIYVFEQVGEQDEPFGVFSTAHVWDLVWTSENILDRQVWSVMAFDIDHDSHDEIIAGVWDHKVHVFDFVDAEAYPYCLDENWFIFEHVWDSGDTISDRVNDIAIVDSDNDTHYEIVAGSQDNIVYLFESCDCLIHEYELIWDSGNTIYAPIVSVAASQNLDDDHYGEIVVSAYGLGVYIFEYNGVTEDYDVRKLNRDIMSWEKGISETAGVYTGYEADIWGDRKVYGWEDQGIYELDPIPPPYDTEQLGGASALGGPADDQETTFMNTEQFEFIRQWTYEIGNETGQFDLPYDIALAEDGTFFLTDFGNNRVVHVNENFEVLMMWGEQGNETSQFDDLTGITLDEAGDVYVAEFGNSRIQKFKPNGTFIAAWGVNGSANGEFYGVFDIAVKNGILYATDYGNHRVQAFDAETGNFLFKWGTLGTGNGQFQLPAGIAIDDEGRAFVSDVIVDRIQVFNATTGVYLYQWGSTGSGPGDLNAPSYMTIGPDNRLFVSDTTNARVQKFSLSGDYESEFGSLGVFPGYFQGPIGLAIHPSGGIVVLDPISARFQLFGVQKYELVQDLTLTQNFGAFDFSYDSEGNYYVTEAATPFIYKYSKDGQYLMNWSIPNSGWAFGIEVAGDDTVFVVDTLNDVVHQFMTNGTLMNSWGSSGSNPGELDGPIAIALHDDILYVSEYINDRISAFNMTSGDVQIISGPGPGFGQVTDPYGMTIGPDGILYVADTGNLRVQRFYPNGTALVGWSVGDSPIFLEFDEDGYLYVTGAYQFSLRKFDPTGNLVDDYNDDFVSYSNRHGHVDSYGIEYLPANHSFVIVDSYSTHKSLIMVHPHIELKDVSEAVVDYGQWEEITGDATPDADFYVVAEDSLDFENIELSISNDLVNFVMIDPADYVFYFEGVLGPFGFTAILGANADNALRDARWDDFRYLRIGVKGGVTYDIDAVYGRVNRPIDTALVVRIGDIKLTEISDGTEEIIVGTTDGEILAYTSKGVKVWESQQDQPRFSLGTQIWDIVQVTGKGRIPTWMFHDEHIQDSDLIGSLPSFDHFVSYSLVNIDYDAALDIVATVREGAYTRLIYLRNTGTDENPNFVYMPNYFVTQSTLSSDQILSHASVTMGDLDGDYDDDLILGTAWLDIDLGWIYELRYFEQTSVDYWTERPGYLSDVGSYVIANGFMPRVSLYDMDYDNDLDLFLTLEDIHFFWQTGYSQGNKFYFQHDTSYVQDINDDFRDGEMPGKIGFSDFDQDNDIDITVPHSTLNITNEGIDTEASRMTYWENTGNRQEVEWTKRRSMFEPDFTGTLLNPDHGYTGPEFHDMNDDGVLDLVVLQQDSIDVFYGRLDHDTFIAATYPYLHMVEVDKRTQNNGFWGYEAYDSWTNWFIFEAWSRSLEYGDVDQDGKPEVFVGSFDNNLIAFEQVANNTYRRSWRSPDIYLRSWFSNVTLPIQMNIRDMVIGDQDGDGLEEIIFTAGYNVYVFEYVENDYYELVWVSPTIQFYDPYDLTKKNPPIPRAPNPITVSEDLDGDGRPEIIVGAQMYIIIYEMVGDNNYTMVWYKYLDQWEAGEANIRALGSADVDRDGFQDFVVIGNDQVIVNGVAYPTYGWMVIFENDHTADNEHINDTYYPWYYELLQGAGYSVDIADNDLNLIPEVMVGISVGVEIHESDGDNMLNYLQFLPTPEPVKAIQAGNTDGDSWLEIVVGTGNNLTVFEQNQTYDRSLHIYDAVWNSGELHEEITDVRIGDSNINGRMEVIATALKGYLYSFEWLGNATGEEAPPFFQATVEPVLEDSGGSQFYFMDDIHWNIKGLLEYLLPERGGMKLSKGGW